MEFIFIINSMVLGIKINNFYPIGTIAILIAPFTHKVNCRSCQIFRDSSHPARIRIKRIIHANCIFSHAITGLCLFGIIEANMVVGIFSFCKAHISIDLFRNQLVRVRLAHTRIVGKVIRIVRSDPIQSPTVIVLFVVHHTFARHTILVITNHNAHRYNIRIPCGFSSCDFKQIHGHIIRRNIGILVDKIRLYLGFTSFSASC